MPDLTKQESQAILSLTDLTIRKAQEIKSLTIPYSQGVLQAIDGGVPHILGSHATLHAMSTVGRLADIFEGADHIGSFGTHRGKPQIADAAADLMIVALHLANLYEFDLEKALLERIATTSQG